MVDLPRDSFRDGTPWTVEVAEASANQWPIFDDDLSLMGHRPRLADAELSLAPGSIRSRVEAITQAFLVTEGTGLEVAVAPGGYLDSNREPVDFGGTTVAVPASTDSFVYITDEGVGVGAEAPALSLLLAKVTAGASTVDTIEDRRGAEYRALAPSPGSTRILGGSNNTDFDVQDGAILDQGEYYCKNFLMDAGVAATISGYAVIRASQDIIIDGTLTILPLLDGAPAFASVLPEVGFVGYAPGQGLGSNGLPYPYGAQEYGSGGSGGGGVTGKTDGTASWGVMGTAGSGGGCLRLEAGGSIIINGTVIAKGGDAQTPAQSFTGAMPNTLLSGSGGGSGGSVFLTASQSVTVASGATIDLRGGDGAIGLSNSGRQAFALGGPGGGGGRLVVASPDNNLTGANVLLDGGDSAAVQGFSTFISPDTWELDNAQAVVGAGKGGANGGAGALWVNESSGSVSRYRRQPGSPGFLTLLDYIPVG